MTENKYSTLIITYIGKMLDPIEDSISISIVAVLVKFWTHKIA